MSSYQTYDSPITTQKKDDWRAAKKVDYICQTQGFDIRMDKTLVHSWVNPTRRLLDSDYVPHLMYAKSPTIGFWDLSLSPNTQYFPVFELFDVRIPDERTLPMEFERLDAFHNKHGEKIKEIWSNDAPEAVKTYNPRSLKNATFY